MPESDIERNDWDKKLIHYHSTAGAAERRAARLRRHRKIWYIRRGLIVGLVIGVLLATLFWALIWG